MKVRYIQEADGSRSNLWEVPSHYMPKEPNEYVIEAEDVLSAKVRMVSYSEMRAKEYPPMADYLDAVVKGDTVAQQAYVDACLAVKTKYPKGKTYRVDL